MSGLHTIAETFCIAGGADDALLFFEKAMALTRLYKRIPEGARLLRLPNSLDDRYRREAHLYKADTNHAQFMEVSIREDKDLNKTVIYEYSTDYEL